MSGVSNWIQAFQASDEEIFTLVPRRLIAAAI
jgi:hypothetical protein